MMFNGISLVKPSLAWEKEILAYKSEFVDAKEEIAGSSSLSNVKRIADWLNHLKLYENHATLPNKEFVPGHQFILVDQYEKKVLGMAHLRIELNDFLQYYGGHIGYSIAPSERKKRYGVFLLSETLKEAQARNINKVLLTCDDDNVGSAKIIEKNNGILDNKIYETETEKWVRRYWIDNSE